ARRWPARTGSAVLGAPSGADAAACRPYRTGQYQSGIIAQESAQLNGAGYLALRRRTVMARARQPTMMRFLLLLIVSVLLLPWATGTATAGASPVLQTRGASALHAGTVQYLHGIPPADFTESDAYGMD